MGNLALSASLFRTDATTSEPDNSGKFVARRICNGIIYYYTPMTAAEHQTVTLAKDSQATSTLLPVSSPVSLETPSRTAVSSQMQSDAASSSRPLLLFFSWLGAQPGAVAKYRELYLDRGLGKTLVPRLEVFVKTTAMLYFRLFKSYTADLYENSIQVFYNSPVTSPALFFFSENDAMCSTTVLEKLMDLWRRRGVSVDGRKWKKSTHAAHLRCHPEEYVSTLQQFLNSLSVPSHESDI
ncbi:uncharacterized protein LOC129375594 isoform X3 [Poeciliopsis prolifica]|uniref:uncharacterized protein LOC129375594 isoform X3 n=1 Tax=Poeciliopsis prolifica TaxID=188132 RepID=UPI0024139DB4|nr:uncharacterized protein LOC129375594 isoform X3 [Poeciliopsis prolifica]